MTAVLDQVKNVAYTGLGVNLVVTDAIVGRDIPAPKAFTKHTITACAKDHGGPRRPPWPYRAARSQGRCSSAQAGRGRRRDRPQGRLGLPRH